MADNVVLNTGVGGDTVAADDIGGIKYSRCKITLGADGSNDGDVSSSNPLPSVQAPATSIVNYGQTTIGLTEVQLTSAAATRGVTLKARAGNSGKIFVGKTGVLTSTGFELSPGDSITLPLSNANLIYCISDTAGQSVCWMVI